jgi:RHS repeat-associated protein
LTYGWDDNKNKTGETIAGTMSNYGFSIPTSGYDDEDRLVSYNRTDGNLDQTWSLSEVGDWDSITTEGTTQTRTHGATHELLTAGGQSLSTDVNGNITLIPSGLRPNASSLLMSWDMDNRLSTADVGNNSSVDVTYKFDALGRRVYRDNGTTAEVFVQSGQQTIADCVAGTTASNPTYRYVYASYIDEPVLRYKPTGSESLYYHRNQQYSVTALTDGSGTIVERYAYSAYGVPTITNASATLRTESSYNNLYMYTGREWDQALQMYHYRARMYDANLGRFCSKDPIGYLDSNNLYSNAFFLSDTDPNGNFTVSGLDRTYCWKQGQWAMQACLLSCSYLPTAKLRTDCMPTCPKAGARSCFEWPLSGAEFSE